MSKPKDIRLKEVRSNKYNAVCAERGLIGTLYAVNGYWLAKPHGKSIKSRQVKRIHDAVVYLENNYR